MSCCHVFCCITHCGDFSGTTRVLKDGRPGVAHYVGVLRGRLSYGLLVHSRGKVRLAARNRRLFHRITVTVRRLACKRGRVVGGGDLRDKRVGVNVDRATVHLCLLSGVRRFRGSCPRIHLGVSGRSAPRTVSTLRGNLISVTVIASPLRVQGPLHGATLHDCRSVLVKNDTCGTVTDQGHSLGRLRSCSFISLVSNAKADSLCVHFFCRGRVQFSPSVRITAASRVLPVIHDGLNVNFYPRKVTEPTMRHKRICRVLLRRRVPRHRVALMRSDKGPRDVTMRGLLACFG